MATATRAKETGRRPEIEAWLDERGFTWDYEEKIPVERFDYDACLRNQARLGEPLNEETVERYKTALTNGESFPAVIAAPSGTKGNARLVTVDGNHRLTAYLSRRRPLDAYVIRGASQAALIAATLEANTRHGLPASETDRVHHAIWLIDNGVPVEDAAKRLGLSKTALRRATNAVEANRRADEAGVLRTDWERLNPYVRERLGHVATDEAFGPMTKLALDANLTTTEVNRVTTQVNGVRSAKKQVELIDEMRKVEYGDRIGRKGMRSKAHRGQQSTGRQRLASVLGMVNGLPSDLDMVATILTSEVSLFVERIDAGIDRLEQVKKALVSKVGE